MIFPKVYVTKAEDKSAMDGLLGVSCYFRRNAKELIVSLYLYLTRIVMRVVF